MVQTIIGAGGAIGIELAKSLTEYTNQIRLVSRNPKKVNENDILVSADVMNANQLDEAIKGSSIVYVTVGFPYSYKVWKENWVKFMQNLLKSCIKHQAKLVFFDNVYMYDVKYIGNMTENTPHNPPSKKGKIRQQVVEMIMEKVKSGKLEALIARSADFYGASIQNTSMLTEMIFKPISEGKKANWMGKNDKKHSFTYTPDAGKATALLGNTADAYNQVWHLPTAKNPYTGKELVEIIAREMGKKPNFQVAPKWMVKLIGLFVPVMREMTEMMYQYENEYIFNSEKFEKKFGIKPTPYLEGIQSIIKQDYSNVRK